MEKQSIYFITNHKWDSPESRGSSIMRAYVPSSFLKKEEGINSTVSKRLPEFAKKNDIVVFVKDFRHLDINVAKNRGCIVVYDPVDEEKYFANNGKFDIVIASSNSHKKILEKNLQIKEEKIVIIDHLHTNIKRRKSIFRKIDDVPIVGAVEPFNFKSFYEDKIKMVCLENNAKYCHYAFEDIKISFDEEIGVKNLYEYHKDLHIALALFDSKKLSRRIFEKPSTKLSSYSSFGIPAILTYQKSYEDVLDKFPSLNNLLAESVDHASEILLKLIKNYDFYLECKDLVEKIGEYFHMKNAKKLYIDGINYASSKNELAS